MLYPVLLAGGSGNRLAPLSTPEYPKQFLTLPGEKLSLLQQTAKDALSLAPVSQILVLASAQHEALVRTQLSSIHPALAEQVLIEEKPLGTARAALMAANRVMEADPQACLWLLPCDHARAKSLQLKHFAQEASQLAAQGQFVTFGVTPSEADAGFGYLIENEQGQLRQIEKPSLGMAAQLIAQGACWNSGMFVFSAAKFITQMQLFCADLDQPLSIDYAIMEKSQELAMIRLGAGWADIGTWARLIDWWGCHAADVPVWNFGRETDWHLNELQHKHQKISG